MAGIILKNQRQNLADLFKKQFDNSNTNNIYAFIGKTTAWTTDAVPPTPTDILDSNSLRLTKDIINMKKIQPSDMSYCTKRYDWVTDTTYSMYKSNAVHSNNFHVIIDDNVYKCLDNNNSGLSTIKPTGRANTSFFTFDNYQWKYMFTVSASDSGKFVTVEYIPLKYLTSNDGSNQWSVQQNAANGSINTYLVNNGGNTYPNHTGTVASANVSHITLASGASSTDNIYNTSSIYIESGLGIGQLRTIVDYTGSTKLARLNSNLSVAPDGTSTYVVSPKVNIDGDGSGATAYCKMSGTAISKIRPVTIGSNYSFANITFTANTGSGANSTAIISPLGGHGANAVTELNGHNIIMNCKFTGSEANTFIVDNSFRVVGLILNPTYANNSLMKNNVYDLTTKLNLTGTTGTFTQNEKITGGSSGAEGYVTTVGSGFLRVSNINKFFSNTEVITGLTSSATSTINGITKPSYELNSGKVLYLEYRSPVLRSSNQDENFKFILNL